MEALLFPVDDLHGLPGFSAWGGNTSVQWELTPVPEVPQQTLLHKQEEALEEIL